MEQNPETLIVRVLTGEASAEEQAALQVWLTQNTSNQELYDSYSEILKQSTESREFQSLSKNLERLNQLIDEHEKERSVNKLTWPKIAASIVFLIASSISIYFFINTFDQPTALVWEERNTASAQKITLQLPDGSIAKLNANSSIRFPKTFEPDLREVFCTGEVFFEVVKDSLHPFVVHTHEVTTRVLGTSFNIRENDAAVVVTVATGKVSVENSKLNEVVLPNQKAIYEKISKELLVRAADLESDLAWKDNVLVFSDTRLDQAATTLESWYGVTISFANEHQGNCLITGKYRNETLEKVLSAISFSTGLQYTRTESRIIWSGTGCNPSIKPKSYE